MSGLHALFLQGMPSPFFARLARALMACGARASAITLSAGDALFWRGLPAHAWRGRREAWPAFFTAYCEREGVTDLILLGEQRAYHREAIAAARRLGLRVTVTDFGYLRPDWITFEPDGMNGSSGLPRDLATIRRAAGALPAPDLGPRFKDSFLNEAFGDLAYSAANVVLAPLYPHYRATVLRPHPLVYFPAMAARLLTGGRRQRQAERAMPAILDGPRRFFVLPLQLEHDFQIAAYSEFETMEEVMEVVFASFAHHGPEDCDLVVKLHPLDPGLRPWPALVARCAARHGLGRGVHFLQAGDLEALLDAAQGLVTVNSTTGLRALMHGLPVKTLGQAVYAVPGLVFDGPLDRFWGEAQPAAAADVDLFLRLLVARTQIRGTFFSEPGLTEAVAQASARVLSRASTEAAADAL